MVEPTIILDPTEEVLGKNLEQIASGMVADAHATSAAIGA